MTRTAFFAAVLLSFSTSACADIVLYYQGSGFDLLAESPLSTNDIICGAVTFPMPLPTTNGASITPTSVVLQTSQGGHASAGFSNSTIMANTATWSATNGLPDTWNLQVGTGASQLKILKDAFDQGDTANMNGMLGLGSIPGIWSTALPAACNTGAHSVVAIAAVPEPSGFLFLSFLAMFIAGGRWLRLRVWLGSS